MFRCVINLAGRASRLESPRTEDWSHWSPVWTKEVLMMIRSPDSPGSPGLTKHSHCMARGQFLREYKGNEGAIMPINMLVRWEVRGPGGLVEVLVVRLVLDTWSPDCWLDCSLWLWWWGLVAVPGLSGVSHNRSWQSLPASSLLTFHSVDVEQSEWWDLRRPVMWWPDNSHQPSATPCQWLQPGWSQSTLSPWAGAAVSPPWGSSVRRS